MNQNSLISNISKEALAELTERIQLLYLSDGIPWVIGYSGGKDSTATVQLIWYALTELDSNQRNFKPVHIISTDTLVESPIVAAWLNTSLDKMKEAAREQDLPINVHKLIPNMRDTFWVSLLGKGYPSPRQNFRWCTERLKIRPANKFITEMVAEHGEAIIVLGTRTSESSTRAATMNKYKKLRIREWLSPTTKLINCLAYTPIEEWDNDDVWIYLKNYPNPWGQDNMELLEMYRGAMSDGECLLAIDTVERDSQNCGSSRFGCWVCTMVTEDKSMQAMIQNDEEKKWMQRLLNFRNKIAVRIGVNDDRDKRDFRRMNGRVMIFNDRAVHGPYTKYWREEWLRELLEIEEDIKEQMPTGFEDFRIISDEELRLIRKIWVLEKHEFEDSLPRIYEEVKGQKFKYQEEITTIFGKSEWDLLKELTGEDQTIFELQTSLLDISQQYMSLVRRKGILQELEEAIRRSYYVDENDAVEQAINKLEKETALDEKIKTLKDVWMS